MASSEKHTACVMADEEKAIGDRNAADEPDVQVAGMTDVSGRSKWTILWEKVSNVEARGIQPIPVEERTNKRTFDIFTLWFTMSTNPLPVVTGMTGTLSYSLSLKACALIILFFNLLATIPVAYLATLGPKIGMRQMIQARYSFGYHLISLPVLLNLATLTGFCIIDSVIGGQTLSAVTEGSMSATVGIVIIALLAMLVCFCGFRILHLYERYAWIPALLAIIIATGTGGVRLHQQLPVPPPAATTVLSFGALVAGYLIPWAALASDFATYMPPTTPAWKTFTYTYFGLLLPSIPLMILGAAIGGAVPNIPSWSTGYDTNSAGGVLAAMLRPAHGFGKFLVVLLAFSMIGNIAATMYSITLNFQLLIPQLLRVPRALFAIIITITVIPISIRAASSFFDNLENFIGVIGYWASAFVAVVLVEHVVFRRSEVKRYDQRAWNDAKGLPSGIAAIGASVCSFGLVVPGMAQIWFTGPIAARTGDIGFEVAFVVTAALYVPFRYLERSVLGR